MRSIAFVGAGPTTLYTLKALLAEAPAAVSLHVFECQAEAGRGSPYSPEWNDRAMLSNIASAELPPVVDTLLDWMRTADPEEMMDLGVDVTQVDDRTFVPRVVLGRYFTDQFNRLVAGARAAGVMIAVHAGCRVVDVVNVANGVDLTWIDKGGEPATARFDHVVLATGHQWPSRQEPRPGYFTSPWPTETLAALPATDIGVRGSSLTAIDAAVVIASAHGAFVREGDDLAYEPAVGSEDLHITLMSRKGLLPEADFYFPLPHAPLSICTPEAIHGLIRDGGPDLLDRAFDLFRREMMALDPAYALRMGLGAATVETFGEAYFAERSAHDPFVWAEANLAEARANHASETTVAWRDALLRTHEVIGAIAPHLDPQAFDRFSRHLKPVFVDAYAAVPHETIERVLALHRAGKLEVMALGDDASIDTLPAEGGAVLVFERLSRRFPIFIEATGQRALGAIQFPFLSLVEQGIVRDAGSDGEAGSRGVEVGEGFNLLAEGVPQDRLFCLSLPFIMGRHPFAQGLTSSHEMGRIVGSRLIDVAGAGRTSVDSLRVVA